MRFMMIGSSSTTRRFFMGLSHSMYQGRKKRQRGGGGQ
jgi:hypothetical protein